MVIGKNDRNSVINHISVDGITIWNTLDIDNAFNDYFANIGNNR